MARAQLHLLPCIFALRLAVLTVISDDEEWENLAVVEHKLYRVEGVPPAPLTLHFVDTEGQLHHRKHLDSNFSHIFDTQTQIFIWNGRGSPPEVKLEMMNRTKQFLKETGRPETLPITICPMGVEPALFRTHFLGTINLLACTYKARFLYGIHRYTRSF